VSKIHDFTCELNNEFLAADTGLDPVSRRWLEAQGIRPGCLEVLPCGPVIVSKIETFEPGIFEFSESGPRAFIHPIWDGPFLADLIAWRPADPATFWTRLYSGTPLGIENLSRAEIYGEPLRIWRSPLGWIRSGGEGAFITDWPMSAPALRCVGALDCEGAAHSAEVHDRLRNPQTLPEIRHPMEAA
jgi:hypothetical protein